MIRSEAELFTSLLNKGFLRLARNAAKQSTYRVKVGCVIALHGKPVAVGWNVVKTHPRYTANSHRLTIHAEVRAVINAGCDLDGGIAYIYRETANGNPALCRPCALCYNILQEAGIKTICYTTDSLPYWRKEKL